MKQTGTWRKSLLFGYMNMALVKVPVWFYVASMLFGIRSEFCSRYSDHCCINVLCSEGQAGIAEGCLSALPVGNEPAYKVFYAVRIGLGLKDYAFLAGCGESWGHAFMCLAFLKAMKLKTNKEQ